MTAVPFDPLTPADRLQAVGVAITADVRAVEVAIKRDLVELERRLTIRVGGMLVVAVGIILTAIRYLPVH
jgi:hypothetical protein